MVNPKNHLNKWLSDVIFHSERRILAQSFFSLKKKSNSIILHFREKKMLTWKSHPASSSACWTESLLWILFVLLTFPKLPKPDYSSLVTVSQAHGGHYIKEWSTMFPHVIFLKVTELCGNLKNWSWDLSEDKSGSSYTVHFMCEYKTLESRSQFSFIETTNNKNSHLKTW